MSMWGMSDGDTLTGDGDFTGSPAANTFTSNHGSVVWDSELEVGDVIVGADGKLYRIATQTANGAATLDRNYEGANAANESITRIKLPRHIKITKDDGTGHTLQSLGIFGVTDAESTAGVDNVTSIGMSGTSSIEGAFYVDCIRNDFRFPKFSRTQIIK